MLLQHQARVELSVCRSFDEDRSMTERYGGERCRCSLLMLRSIDLGQKSDNSRVLVLACSPVLGLALAGVYVALEYLAEYS